MCICVSGSTRTQRNMGREIAEEGYRRAVYRPTTTLFFSLTSQMERTGVVILVGGCSWSPNTLILFKTQRTQIFQTNLRNLKKNNTNNRDTANKNIKDIYYNHDKRRDKKILHIPDWFKNVLLCFKFYAPSPENHSPPGNATCAGLNEYTPYYHDRYGYQKRFVAMSWAIMYPDYNRENSNPVIPAWALENRICLSHYRQVVIPLLWYTTVRKQKCSSLNEYSYNYLDGSFYKSLFKNTKNYIQWALVNSFTFPTPN